MRWEDCVKCDQERVGGEWKQQQKIKELNTGDKECGERKVKTEKMTVTMANVTQPPRLFRLSFLNIKQPVRANSVTNIFSNVYDSVIPFTRGSISATIISNSPFLLTMLWAFSTLI